MVLYPRKSNTSQLLPARRISLSSLPEELLLEICKWLPMVDVVMLCRTSKRLYTLSQTRILWIVRMRSLLSQYRLEEGQYTFPLSTMSTSDLRWMLLRPHRTPHALLRHHKSASGPFLYRFRPGVEDQLTVTHLNFLPGGRWLLAVCADTSGFQTSRIAVWDLHWDQGKYPVAQYAFEMRVRCCEVLCIRPNGSMLLVVGLVARNSNNPASSTSIYRIDVLRFSFKSVLYGRQDSSKPFSLFRQLSLGSTWFSSIVCSEGKAAITMGPNAPMGLNPPMGLNALIWDVEADRCILLHVTRGRPLHSYPPRKYEAKVAKDVLLVANGGEGKLHAYRIGTLQARPKHFDQLVARHSTPFLTHSLPPRIRSLRFSRDIDNWRWIDHHDDLQFRFRRHTLAVETPTMQSIISIPYELPQQMQLPIVISMRPCNIPIRPRPPGILWTGTLGGDIPELDISLINNVSGGIDAYYVRHPAQLVEGHIDELEHGELKTLGKRPGTEIAIAATMDWMSGRIAGAFTGINGVAVFHLA